MARSALDVPIAMFPFSNGLNHYMKSFVILIGKFR